MRLLVLAAMQAIYWSAFYALIGRMSDDKFLFAVFGVTLLISMVTAALFLAKPR